MAIIKSTRLSKKNKIKVEINSDIMATINQYCEWANIEDLGFFFEEAASFIFAKDREWKLHQKKLTKMTQDV